MKKLIYAFIMGVMLCACVAKPAPVETVNTEEVADSISLDSLCSDTIAVDSVSMDSIEVL